ncbi:hypothetical protein [Rhizobium sp. PP-F2F-G48]|uniref:hypothetical protein n=1 Tax=Rhizobium sp. PP-F2F-G48 TaxID=2135651 RepID=UPI00104DA57E|nr:hypothetical protein [Rhizobium sp. PP-F2F-G48]
MTRPAPVRRERSKAAVPQTSDKRSIGLALLRDILVTVFAAPSAEQILFGVSAYAASCRDFDGGEMRRG